MGTILCRCGGRVLWFHRARSSGSGYCVREACSTGPGSEVESRRRHGPSSFGGSLSGSAHVYHPSSRRIDCGIRWTQKGDSVHIGSDAPSLAGNPAWRRNLRYRNVISRSNAIEQNPIRDRVRGYRTPLRSFSGSSLPLGRSPHGIRCLSRRSTGRRRFPPHVPLQEETCTYHTESEVASSSALPDTVRPIDLLRGAD